LSTDGHLIGSNDHSTIVYDSFIVKRLSDVANFHLASAVDFQTLIDILNLC